MPKKYIWTEDDKKFIRDNAKTMVDSAIAEELGKRKGMDINVQSIRKLRQGMGIFKERGRGICKVVQRKECSDVGAVVMPRT